MRQDTPTSPREAHHGEIWMIVLSGLVHTRDMQVQLDQPEGFPGINGSPLGGVGRGPRGVEVEVEVVEVGVVEEADYAHPGAGDTVRVELVEVGAGWSAHGG